LKKGRKQDFEMKAQAGLMKRNFIRGVGVIFCGAVLLWGIDAAFDMAQNSRDPNAFTGQHSKVSLWSVLQNNADETRNNLNLLPQGFQAEVFPVEIFYGIRVSQEGGVIGLFSHQSKGELRDYCEKEILSHGWTKVESGYEGCISFVKERGSFTWLFLSFFEVKGEASVLVSIQ